MLVIPHRYGSKNPKVPKLVGPAISPKFYTTSDPSVSDVALDYLFPEDIPIHAVQKIRANLSPNTLRLLLSQITVVRLPLNPFYSSLFLLLMTLPFTIHPNIFRILSCVIFMCAIEGIDIRPEDLLYLHRVKHRKGGCFNFLTKYFSMNPPIEPMEHRGAFDIVAYSLEKKWAHHIFDVSGNFHLEDGFGIPISDRDLYDLDKPIPAFPHRAACPYATIAVSRLSKVATICIIGVLDFLQRIQVRGPLDFSISDADKESFSVPSNSPRRT